MFGIGFIFILFIFTVILYRVSKLFVSWQGKLFFVILVFGSLGAYPYAYKLSPSYSKFLELCDNSNRYQVLNTKLVNYIYLDRNLGADCMGGPSFIKNTSFIGFDCEGPNTRTTTATFRYTKKPNWNPSCGIECFDSNILNVPEAKYKVGYRQGYITGNITTVTYDPSGAHGQESSGDKLRFSDSLLLDNGTEMAFTRNYIYYPYGDGWAKILGAASGSAPSKYCKVQSVNWDIRDVYKPLAKP